MAGEQHFRVRVGEHAHDVGVVLQGDHDANVVIDGREFEVRFISPDTAVVRDKAGFAQTTVALDGQRFPAAAAVAGNGFALEVKTAQAAASEELLAAVSGAGSGHERIAAPMPGRIVRVLVAQGDDIGADTAVIIVEAMKMENELRSTIAGVVQAIHVAEGDTVDAGKILCEIAAHADSD